jgi:hypothetical protein
MLVSLNSKTNYVGSFCSQKQPATMQPLAFRSNDTFVKSNPKSSVAFAGKEEYKNKLIKELLSTDSDTRERARKELSKDAIVLNRTDSSLTIGLPDRKAIINFLKEHISIVIEALTDSDVNIRFSAARTLGEIGDKSAVAPLIKALREDEDNDVRKFAAEALGKIGDTRAIEPLKEASINDEKDFVRATAKISLAQLRGISISDLIQEIEQ